MKEVASYLIHVMILAALWLVLTGGDASSWLVGAPVIVIAVISFRRVAGPQDGVQLNWFGIVRFVFFFLWRCFTAGMDVARRALSPTISLEPALIERRIGLPQGASRVVFASVINLLPGTLSAGLEDDRVTVHVLDGRHDFERELRVVERRVADMFGIELDSAMEQGG